MHEKEWNKNYKCKLLLLQNQNWKKKNDLKCNAKAIKILSSIFNTYIHAYILPIENTNVVVVAFTYLKLKEYAYIENSFGINFNVYLLYQNDR